MSVVSFENLKITTITLVIMLDGSVNLNEAFELLKVTRVNLPPPKRSTQKYKIPNRLLWQSGTEPEPGSIFSLRYRGNTRGIVRSTSKKHFKNAITIDCATSTKNISMKLSRTKIHICGASSMEQAVEGCQQVINQLLNIQDNLDYIQQNLDKAEAIIKWLKDASQGEEVIRPVGESLDTEETDITDSSESSISEEMTSSPIKIQGVSPGAVDYLIKDISNIPNDLDMKIVSFLSGLHKDFIYHSDFCAKLDWIKTIKEVTTRPLAISDVCTAMANYNYDLGFNVKRLEFAKLINHLNGFFARFDNSIDHSVIVTLPYEIPERCKKLRRRNKFTCHTFLVYESGLVTQSGPGGDIMRDAYYLFNETVNQIRDEVMKVGVPHILKYTPSWALKKNNDNTRMIDVVA
jgi:hypothetical protein